MTKQPTEKIIGMTTVQENMQSGHAVTVIEKYTEDGAIKLVVRKSLPDDYEKMYD